MERDLRMTIEIPKDQEENFRIFTVIHGGAVKDGGGKVMRIAPEYICDCLCKHMPQSVNPENMELTKTTYCSKCPVRYQKDENIGKVTSELKSIGSELKNITKKLGGLKR